MKKNTRYAIVDFIVAGIETLVLIINLIKNNSTTTEVILNILAIILFIICGFSFLKDKDK